MRFFHLRLIVFFKNFKLFSFCQLEKLLIYNVLFTLELKRKTIQFYVNNRCKDPLKSFLGFEKTISFKTGFVIKQISSYAQNIHIYIISPVCCCCCCLLLFVYYILCVWIRLSIINIFRYLILYRRALNY